MNQSHNTLVKANRLMTARASTRQRFVHLLFAWLFAFAIALPQAQPLFAQNPGGASAPAGASTGHSEGLPGLTVTGDAAGASIRYAATIAASLPETLALAGETQRYQGYDLPLQVVPLAVPGAEYADALQIVRVESVDVPADLVQPGPPEDLGLLPLDEAAASAAGEQLTGFEIDLASLAIQPDPALPTAPVFVLRSGIIDGNWTVVLGVTPIFQEEGVTRFATAFEAFMPGAQPLERSVTSASQSEAAALTGEALQTAGIAPDVAEACAAYTLPLLDSGERILRVSTPGLQSVARSTLGPLAALNANQLSLTRNGNAVPIQISGANLLFYADTVGDRWNPTDAYVLRPASAQYPATVMAAAQAVSALGGAGAPSAVIDRGIWRNNVLYSSQHSGFDGDHWSAGDLWIIPGSSTPNSPPVSVVLNNSALNTPSNKLPLGNGATTLTFNVSPYRRVTTSPRLYNLVATIGGSNTTIAFPEFEVVNPAQDWPDGISQSHTFATNPTALSLSLAQVAGNNAQSGLLVDSIAYARPATLALAGNGAVFEGNSGQTQYRWSGAASGFLLYDVTDPQAPVPLAGASAAGFSDGRGAARRYLVTGTGFLHTPAVEVKYLQEYKNLSDVQAIYVVANTEFAGALKPLTDLRCASYKVAVVDIKAIYNRYSNSQVSADAVRNFLRDAWYDGSEVGAPSFNYFTWSPLSVVMVGDATYDPWNFSKKTGKNYNLVPAYMHPDIDPYIGEAACDNCYGQLNGDDPHTGDAQNGRPGFFTMEIHVGRLPANSATEVLDVANKIVRYETMGVDLDLWRGTTLLFADNYWKPDGSGGYFRDPAGNFANTADDLREIVNDGRNPSLSQRRYWDPAPQLNVPSAVGQSWRSNTRTALKTDVLKALNSKPALVLYNGHANHFHMGSTESPSGDTTREYVLMFQDIGELRNGAEPFLLLSMTCQTSQFVYPTDFGRTIDEFYLLAPVGGAFATWGSTGLSPVAGHETLQEGFLHQLLGTSSYQTLGVLMRAGYENVLLNGVNADDILRTFMLMGDPLTKFRFNAHTSQAYLPRVSR